MPHGRRSTDLVRTQPERLASLWARPRGDHGGNPVWPQLRWGDLRSERPRPGGLPAQTGCSRWLRRFPGARFLAPGDTGSESAHSAAGWARSSGRCYPQPVRLIAPQTPNSRSTEACHPMIRRVIRRARRMNGQGKWLANDRSLTCLVIHSGQLPLGGGKQVMAFGFQLALRSGERLVAVLAAGWALTIQDDPGQRLEQRRQLRQTGRRPRWPALGASATPPPRSGADGTRNARTARTPTR